ncbi:MAG: FecR domain-containing protein, partial [Hymenobacter sp.]|nr:FecR domain-containing protein [Hymenobacter sp.]
MRPENSTLNSLRQRIIRHLRRKRTAHQKQQLEREQWLDALAAATPDDDALTDAGLQASRRERLLDRVRAGTQPARMVALWPAGAPPAAAPKPRVALWPALKVAAVLVPLLLLGAVLWQRLRVVPELRYATSIGEYREVVLPDRSHVWLRPRSELRCAATFGATRTVRLRGEAFFDVTKDRAHPFVVRTAAVAVRVLGTSFNVKAYPKLPATTVLVRTGRVQV